MHNGYRTLGESSTLAQVGWACGSLVEGYTRFRSCSGGCQLRQLRSLRVARYSIPCPSISQYPALLPSLRPHPAPLQLHPSCARVAADDDGLLPEWMVYHELVSTGRVYLSKASCLLFTACGSCRPGG